MKLSELNVRIAGVQERLDDLEAVRRMHHAKRPEEWKGRAAELKEEIERLRGEVEGLKKWRDGKWVEDS